MATLAQIRADLASVLETIPGWNVNNGYIGDQVLQYSFKIARPAFDPRMVFSEAKKSVTFTVTAYAPRIPAEEAEAAIDALCEPSGSGSLIAAVQTGSNWSQTIDYAQVVSCGETQVIVWAQDSVEYLGAQFQIEVVW